MNWLFVSNKAARWAFLGGAAFSEREKVLSRSSDDERWLTEESQLICPSQAQSRVLADVK